MPCIRPGSVAGFVSERIENLERRRPLARMNKNHRLLVRNRMIPALAQMFSAALTFWETVGDDYFKRRLWNDVLSNCLISALGPGLLVNLSIIAGAVFKRLQFCSSCFNHTSSAALLVKCQ